MKRNALNTVRRLNCEHKSDTKQNVKYAITRANDGKFLTAVNYDRGVSSWGGHALDAKIYKKLDSARMMAMQLAMCEGIHVCVGELKPTNEGCEFEKLTEFF